ncbi:MAG: hypothetical protein WD004_02250 [Actinomycetota bacterium]
MSRTSSSELPRRRKPYETPRLAVYGDMRRLTAGVKGGVKGDGPDDPGGPSTRIVS